MRKNSISNFVIEDQVLIQDYVQGNEKSLVFLIERYQTKIFTSIYLLVKNRELAEDIFQETFIKIIENLRQGRYQEEGKFLSWAGRIAHNLVIDHFRKEKNRTQSIQPNGIDLIENLVVEDENIEQALIRRETYSHLYYCIHQLPDDQKEVLIMRHYAEMSFKEIADLTDVSINTALGRMRYALQNLRKLMMDSQTVLKTG